MKRSVQFLLIGLFLGTVCGAVSTTTSIPVTCTKPKGAVCVIKLLPSADGDKTTIAFPSLTKRTTLKVLEGTFSNLTQAQALTLTVRNVKMEGLALESIFVTASFEELHLRDNLLKTVQTNTGAPETFALKLLDVRNNKLNNATQLAPFVRLEELYLDDNQINQLSMDLFARMSKLRVLSAPGNGILTIVPPASMVVLSELKSLHLGRNRLTSIEMENWQLPSLQSLQLNNNSLEVLVGVDEFNQFYDLSELSLAGNRWSCGWLQHALGNVNVRKSLHDNEGVVLDADTDCSLEKVLGICCSFASTAQHEEEQIFLPEIEQVRTAISQINRRQDQFMSYRTNKQKELREALQERLNRLMNSANQKNESERANMKAKQMKEQANLLSKKIEQMVSEMHTARSIEQERKRLLHFMVYMKNKLIHQAIDIDSLWVQANVETINLEQRVQHAP